MLVFYIYSVLLLLMIILLYNGLAVSFKHAPIKIKILSSITAILLSFRYFALILLLTLKNIKYLYMLKPFYFFDLLCIPITALITIYILARNDKIKFYVIFIISGIFSLVYGYIIYSFDGALGIASNYGYIMFFLKNNYVYGAYLIVITIFLITTALLLGNKNSNKLGIILCFISSILTICELIVNFMGITLFPNMIIGDICWVITLNYSLNKLKK